MYNEEKLSVKDLLKIVISIIVILVIMHFINKPWRNYIDKYTLPQNVIDNYIEDSRYIKDIIVDDSTYTLIYNDGVELKVFEFDLNSKILTINDKVTLY